MIASTLLCDLSSDTHLNHFAGRLNHFAGLFPDAHLHPHGDLSQGTHLDTSIQLVICLQIHIYIYTACDTPPDMHFQKCVMGKKI